MTAPIIRDTTPATVDATAFPAGVGTDSTPTPAGADMPATVTNGVRPSVEYVGRGEWQNRLRDAARNLAALGEHVKAHPDAEERAGAPRAMYEKMRDDANKALGNQPATPEATPPESAPPPARSGAQAAAPTDRTHTTVADGEE